MTAQSAGRDAPIAMPANAVLANMWTYAYQVQDQYDLLVNFAYDWLPFYLTPFFDCPIAHLVSMGSLTNAMDEVIGQTIAQFPNSIGVHSRAQADTFTFGAQCRVLGNGFDLSLYEFCSQPERSLAWVGRLAPEKGLEDAVAAAQATQIPLKIWGIMQDQSYWQQIQQRYPTALITYEGFLPTAQLQKALGKCQTLIMTPRWVEAFGNVAIEALACGVPVIAYRRGGPAEIVQHGKTGWLVEPDDIDGLVDAIARVDEIDRYACRQQAEADYSLAAMGDRLEQWFATMLGSVRSLILVKRLTHRLFAIQTYTYLGAKNCFLIQVTEPRHVIKITYKDDLDRIRQKALKTYFRGLNFSRVINREHTTDRQPRKSPSVFY